MHSESRLIVWILIAHLCILFAGGHGGGTIGLLEAAMLIELVSQGDLGAVREWMNAGFFTVAVVGLIGQLILLISIWTRPPTRKIFQGSGVLLLFLSFGSLLHCLWYQPTVVTTTISGIPFVVLSFVLIYKMFNGKDSTDADRYEFVEDDETR